MAQKSVITEDLKKLIGLEREPFRIEVEKGMLRSLATAIRDPNPLWSDEKRARHSRYGGLIAPPALFCSAQIMGTYVWPVESGLKRHLDGALEIEMKTPVRAGDVITCVVKLVDLYEKEGKLGLMLFQVNEATMTNQFGEVVGTQRSTLISY